ncbi:MAG: transcriptional repressor [Deltaproteobacteria bacterium]|nr:transcriptional repressor [Deltaproteobacteria bacterium]
MTPQRMAILEYLKDNKEHPSALDVFRAVSMKFPTISFATVYNTLEMLKKRGLLHELTVDPQRKRFDPSTTPHSHAVCTKCGKVFDITTEISFSLPSTLPEGFQVERVQIDLYGICQSCK